jgi:hypothetical protein
MSKTLATIAGAVLLIGVGADVAKSNGWDKEMETPARASRAVRTWFYQYEQLAKLEVRDVDATAVQQEQVTRAPSPGASTDTAVAAPARNSEAPRPLTDIVVVTQNNAPAQETSDARAPSYDDDVRAEEELPGTASNIALLLVVGLIAFLSAIAVRLTRRL